MNLKHLLKGQAQHGQAEMPFLSSTKTKGCLGKIPFLGKAAVCPGDQEICLCITDNRHCRGLRSKRTRKGKPSQHYFYYER